MHNALYTNASSDRITESNVDREKDAGETPETAANRSLVIVYTHTHDMFVVYTHMQAQTCLMHVINNAQGIIVRKVELRRAAWMYMHILHSCYAHYYDGIALCVVLNVT